MSGADRRRADRGGPPPAVERRRTQRSGAPEEERSAIRSPWGERFEVVARAGPVELQRAPSIPAEAREELLVIKDAELFVCARTDGEIAPAQVSGEGFYAFDTRYLSELRLQVGGARPVALSSSMTQARAVVDSTNAQLRRGTLQPIPQLSLSIRRELMVAAGRLYYTLRLRSFRRERLATTVSLTLGADFADMFEVRGGIRREHRGHALAPKRRGRQLVLAYVGEDSAFRESVIDFEWAPDQLELEAGRARARWRVELEQGVEQDLLVTVEPSIGGQRRPRRAARTAARALDQASAQWDTRRTVVRSDNESFEAVIRAAARDLHALITPAPGGQLVSAGIPWYVAAFGRDALITAGEAMLLGPELSRDALEVLAKLQATADDPWRDAEPGKILHELRIGELAGAGVIPHTPYYGTADATPLFLIRAAHYYRWTADLETMRRLRPALDGALTWIDRHGDRDGDGFVEYLQRSPGGLLNQGWKDSNDSVMHADGQLAQGPIALVEVQGYVYAAKLTIADVYDALGEPLIAKGLREQAALLRERFNAAFWMPELGTFALALDGDKRQVASVTSNPGHCLYTGIVDEDKAPKLIRRLMAPDMFSGWGIRTLSRESPAYNPMSYHNGSVWPHDNALIAAGMKRYGDDESVLRIAGALFDVATRSQELRLPELYCGFDRVRRPALVAYPVACSPQAWAAAAPLLLLQAMLGISADAPARALRVQRPTLPDWLRRVRLEGLRVGDASVTLQFERDAEVTGFALVSQRGELDVTMAPHRAAQPD